MGWEDQARIKRQGEKYEIDSLSGLWFRPQKYSVEASESIALLRQKLSGQFDPALLKKLITKYRELDKELTTTKDVLEALEPEELIELTQSMKLEGKESSLEYKKQVLLCGIGEHNFTSEDGKPEIIDQEFVDRLCEYQKTAEEMLLVIEEWNHPLALKSHTKSGTLSSGSSQEQNSPESEKTESSRTEPIQ